MLTYNGRCEGGHTREMCAVTRDVGGSWVSESTRRESGGVGAWSEIERECRL